MPPLTTQIPILQRAQEFALRTAIADSSGESTYGQLLQASARVASALLAGRADLQEARVGFLIPPSFDWVAVQWGIWLAGGVAVPLCLSHPSPELRHVLEDTQAEAVVFRPDLSGPLEEAAGGRKLFRSDHLLEGDREVELPPVDPSRRAQILYTSGTTSRPKGVVTTHRNLRAQITSLTRAWGWSSRDRILEVLPLHHTHGIVNVVGCALWSGAVCEMLPHFDAAEVWERFASGRLTLFMAVPTIYVKLIRFWREQPSTRRRELSQASRLMRLMVSGSAALPVSVLEEWREITGHTLLERYGMTEIGMALSNPLQGERRPGSVGFPLPGVHVRLVDDGGQPIRQEGEPGEIEIRGEAVFLEYWGQPEATRSAFRKGWFRTGDMAFLENGYFRILGRRSVDIIKTGGYKVSALEIEEALGTHASILECAVVGVEDEEWGERVCCAAVCRPGQTLVLDDLREWGRQRLAVYKIPSRLEIVAELPRNAMGKVTKPEVRKLFEGPGDQGERLPRAEGGG